MISQPRYTPIAGRPASVTIASYGVLGVLATVFTSSVLPPIFTSSSVRAVVNAPVSSLTSPINGTVTSMAGKKEDFYEGPIVTVQNERVDRTTFIGLQVESTSLQNELLLKQANLEDYLNRIKDLETELSTQQNALIARSSNELRDAEVRLNLATYSAANEKTDSERKLRLVSKGVLPGTKDELLNKIRLEDAKVEAAKLKVDMSTDDLGFAQRGIYVGDNNQYLQNLQNEIRARKADVSQISMQIASITTRLVQLQSLTESERQRIDKMTKADVAITKSEKIYKTIAQVGKQVNAGDTLVQSVDCSEAFVVAIFSERQAQALSVGSKVVVESAAWTSPVQGLVSRLLPRTTDRVDLDFAVPFPPTERRELYAFVVPEKTDAATIANFCSVGTWVEVTRQRDWAEKTRNYVDGATAALVEEVKRLELAFATGGTKIASVAALSSTQAGAASLPSEPGLPTGKKIAAVLPASKNPACIGNKCQASDYLFDRRLKAESQPFRHARIMADIGSKAVFDTRWN
ncbi:HlyD family efflux transporter periplasmic adaptor subunit [Phyllobacterium zundukense]|nr:HlyD family efflux transporter periplasmic adaptor subunit [Phyllobacterium zundukense]